MHKSLGDFIRLHRQRIKPRDVGMPDGGRRRTPGLRREELAQLCRVSATWLTWLEQGRPVSASADMLARLADALHLSAAERRYLFELADRIDPAAAGMALSSSDRMLSGVDVIDAPAYVLDRQWNAVSWNRHAQDLFAGWLDRPEPGSAPNLLRYMFLQPAARSLIVDWPNRARRLVAEFRADCGKLVDDAAIANLVAELSSRSPEFARLWANHDVVDREGGKRRFHHPHKGELEFEQLTFHPATRSDLKLVMLVPGAAS